MMFLKQTRKIFQSFPGLKEQERGIAFLPAEY